MRKILQEPLTCDDVKRIVKDHELNEIDARSYLKAARGAAENYIGVPIALGADDDETTGWEYAEVPAEIRMAMEMYVIGIYERSIDRGWLNLFYRLLDPWRKPPCL